MPASVAVCRSVRSSGFFHRANLAPLRSFAVVFWPPLRAAFHTSRRTSSSALVPQATMWNGSRQSSAFLHRAATTSAIHSAASALTKVISVSYTHLRAHETDSYLVCRLLLEKK